MAVVVNDERIVLGLVSAEQLADGSAELVEDLPLAVPTTYRAHVALDDVLPDDPTDVDDGWKVVTTPEGVLLGVFRPGSSSTQGGAAWNR